MHRTSAPALYQSRYTLCVIACVYACSYYVTLLAVKELVGVFLVRVIVLSEYKIA